MKYHKAKRRYHPDISVQVGRKTFRIEESSRVCGRQVLRAIRKDIDKAIDALEG